MFQNKWSSLYFHNISWTFWSILELFFKKDSSFDSLSDRLLFILLNNFYRFVSCASKRNNFLLQHPNEFFSQCAWVPQLVNISMSLYPSWWTERICPKYSNPKDSNRNYSPGHVSLSINIGNTILASGGEYVLFRCLVGRSSCFQIYCFRIVEQMAVLPWWWLRVPFSNRTRGTTLSEHTANHTIIFCGNFRCCFFPLLRFASYLLTAHIRPFSLL